MGENYSISSILLVALVAALEAAVLKINNQGATIATDEATLAQDVTDKAALQQSVATLQAAADEHNATADQPLPDDLTARINALNVLPASPSPAPAPDPTPDPTPVVPAPDTTASTSTSSPTGPIGVSL